MSSFDYESLNLGLYQEYIELDLFHHGLAMFSPEEFEAEGVTAEDQFLINHMANQELGHATLITNILGPENAAKECNYTYPFSSVKGFLDFSMLITRAGESGVFGFLEHLNSRAAAQLLLESISTESRQEMAFRQLQGLFSMPVWFTPAITQSMQWTLIAPYITSCPSSNPRVGWQNFPALNITNALNAANLPLNASISNNVTALSSPGQTLNLTWESPGKQVGPNLAYTTTTTAGAPKYVAWISQLNTTYTPLENISGNSGTTVQPGGQIYGNGTTPTVNGTVFVVVTDSNPYVTPFNLTLLNAHVVAGPAIYESG